MLIEHEDGRLFVPYVPSADDPGGDVGLYKEGLYLRGIHGRLSMMVEPLVVRSALKAALAAPGSAQELASWQPGRGVGHLRAEGDTVVLFLRDPYYQIEGTFTLPKESVSALSAWLDEYAASQPLKELEPAERLVLDALLSGRNESSIPDAFTLPEILALTALDDESAQQACRALAKDETVLYLAPLAPMSKAELAELRYLEGEDIEQYSDRDQTARYSIGVRGLAFA
jgi:hypothetical protein